MKNEKLPQRKHIRLKRWDYATAGGYYITICTHGKRKLFWTDQSCKYDVGANCVRPPLSALGNIVANEIGKLSGVYDTMSVDKYVVMPNHLHIILVLGQGTGGRPQVAPTDGNGGRPQVAPTEGLGTPTVSRIVKQFKGSVSKQIGSPIWQRSFYDHIIRDEADYLRIWEYIDTNPLKWEEDEYYRP